MSGPLGTVEIHADADAVAEVVAARIVALAGEARVGVVLAGGTTPRAIYQRLATGLRAVDAPGLHLWYGDERMVGPTHPDSNAAMVRAAWLDPAGWPAGRDHRIEGERGAAAAAAAASAALRAHDGDDPRLDLVLLGVGADGHTASLFPGDDALDAPGLFVPARAGARVSASLPLLARARRVIFVATGAGKAEVLGRLLAGGGPGRDLPAARVARAGADAGSQVTWIIDAAAAAWP